ncbi:putative NBD/HSP70 family sugar kinase [Pullulanibacillus pueri]|uniref:Xylose repressor n=1 Tax=Pullulanibacillus pueri TaxID=1437324 RepID=A0A8J2ZST3_9BACL|nr:ROK family transcriptional regulator [Pullulanibacillus pueri]MBM7681817.1 putative NBD/HSP70 family sugar kinase [Pullulanibacillus pueri]GGH76204.1 xylose repressor [Pullulanibacillus pueri]
MKTGDLNLVKKINKSIVLTTIQNMAPLSRANISEITGLNKATVSSLVAELIDEALVGETGPGESSGGRRPVMLYFNKKAGFSIGVDLGVNYMLAVLTDLSGTIIYEKQTELEPQTNQEAIFTKLSLLIKDTMDHVPESPYGIIGVGIGVPGITNNEGDVLLAPNLGWGFTDIKGYLAKQFDIPIIIDNEANAGAYGEKLYGSGKTLANFIYTSIGIGIGSGIVIDNSLFRGATGISGEMGHFTINAHGPTCRCGNKGCWELYASEQALLKEAQNLPSLKERKDINLELLIQLAEAGDQDILQLFDLIGEYIGIGFVNIANTFNPQAIILGNRFSLIKKWIFEAINRTIAQRLSVSQETEIKFSERGIYSCALGSAAFVIEAFFSHRKVTVE